MSLAALLRYHRRSPLDLQVVGTEARSGVRIQDISYSSPWTGRVPAYLVLPAGPPSYAGILFMHPGGADRNAFLDEAIAFARVGAAGLLIDGPDVRPPGRELIEFNDSDRDVFLQAVADLRRGVDLLVERPGMDARRIGYIGSSYGATLGAMLASVEKRIRSLVIMSGSARLTYFLRRMADSMASDQLEAYLEMMAVIDPVGHIGQASPSDLLLQNGLQDEFVPPAEVEALYDAASEPKTIRWYEAGHALDAQAASDRMAWLGARLGLGLDGGARRQGVH